MKKARIIGYAAALILATLALAPRPASSARCADGDIPCVTTSGTGSCGSGCAGMCIGGLHTAACAYRRCSSDTPVCAVVNAYAKTGCFQDRDCPSGDVCVTDSGPGGCGTGFSQCMTPCLEPTTTTTTSTTTTTAVTLGIYYVQVNDDVDNGTFNHISQDQFIYDAESDAQAKLPQAIVARALTVRLGAALTGGQTLSVAFNVNGVDSALVASFTSGSGTVVTATGSVAAADGDTYYYHATLGGGATSATIRSVTLGYEAH